MGIRGDWATYNIEHGGDLAILFPNWMEHVLDAGPERFKQMAVNVFGIDPANKSAW